jgi:hypothetical protein
MTWTTPADLRAQVQRLWDRGRLLASLVDGEALFPLRLRLKGPSSAELADRFAEVRHWIAELRQGAHYRVVMSEVRHRVLGANQVPAEVWIDTLDDALALIGRTRDAKRFRGLVSLTREREPSALVWLARRPLDALELAQEWTLLLDVVAWVQARPRPGTYLREIDVPGVHTKLVEARRAVLTALLDAALPAEAIDDRFAGASQFCQRYGFRDKPARVRFRLLDPRLSLLSPGTDQDLTVNADTFARLEPPVRRVFVTENEINFLAFPRVDDSLVVFGAGYGFETLAAADWLRRCDLHYWGDIDTHGFAILDQLRGLFPDAASFLMDRETLMAHESHWAEEPRPASRDLPHLRPAEHALYDDLRHDRIRPALRLEQERVGFRWLEAALAGVTDTGGPA